MNILIRRPRHADTCDQIEELLSRFRDGTMGVPWLPMPNVTATDVVRIAVADMHRRISPVKDGGASA